MKRNIVIGILTESAPLTATIERGLSRDERFEVRALDLQRDDLRTPDDIDVLLVSSALPATETLPLLGRSWMSHRFPRLFFVRAGRPPGPEARLTTECSIELADVADAAAHHRRPIPARLTLRFLEPESGQGNAEAVAVGR
ncbi:MAG TPA: hypothetical protein VMR66_10815 [Gemmatimonadota bacterium]|nr:hypothetical protein [Gemmatimonadota bacterium]